MISKNRATARAFIEATATGKIPEELVTEDFAAWTTVSGEMPGDQFLGAVGVLASVFASPMKMEIDAITAEDDRVVVESRSSGPLISGDEYRNRYVFVFRMRDGKVASLAEHHDPLVASAKLGPLMQAVLAKPA